MHNGFKGVLDKTLQYVITAKKFGLLNQTITRKKLVTE